MKICETFECSGQILWNSLCQFWNKLIPLEILCPSSVSLRITPLYLFSSNNVYFAHKEPIKVKIFETFECSGQSLTNSLSQFLNDKLIPPQILYPSSVSWKITPPYFFSSYNIEIVWAKKVQRSSLSWNWRGTQKLERNQLVVSKLAKELTKTWQILTWALKSLTNVHFNVFLLSTVYID